MTKPSVDAAIMFERTRLETYWRNTLNDTQRAIWLARWTSRPPYDIAARKYVADEPQSLNEIRVSIPTQFAWSQIYGTLRFGTPPIAIPSDPPTPTLDIAILSLAQADIRLSLTITPTPTSPLQILVYATAPQYSTTPGLIWKLRPISQVTLTTPLTSLTLTTPYHQAHTYQPDRVIAFRAATINTNNELDGLSNIAAAVSS